MVATQFARGRATAAAILATLLLSIVPFTPAQAQAAPGDVSVIQGEADWYQGNFFGGSRPTAFIDNGTVSSVLNVTVYNVGAEIANVPVYYWFEGMTDRTDCKKITLPQGTTSEPGKKTVEFDVHTRPLAPGAHNVTISVFPTAKPDQVEAEEECDGTVARQTSASSPCVLNCRAETNANNNVIKAFFVKERYLDLKIAGVRWCEGTPIANPATGELGSVCEEMNSEGTDVYNVTPTDDARVDSYFEVIVENVANKEWSWANLSDYGGRCVVGGPCDLARTGFEYELNVTVRGKYIDGVRNISSFVQTTQGYGNDGESIRHRPWTSAFVLNGLAGPYNLTIKLDPAKHLRRHPTDTAADTRWMEPPPEVAYRDFTGNFSAPGTPGAFAGMSVETAYDHDTFIEISGDITFANRGPAGRGDTPVQYTIYLDNLSWTDALNNVHHNTRFKREVNFLPQGNHSTQTYALTWTASNNLASDNYLPPGRHTIHVKADNASEMLEYNETNNDFSIDIFIKDTTAPRFNGTPQIALVNADPPGSPARTFYRPHEGVNFVAKVTDDDNGVKVAVNFTLDSNQSVFRVVNATREPTDAEPDRFVATVLDFKFNNFTALCFNCTENWTARVSAIDSFNNSAPVATLPFRLKPWPIHNASADYVIITPDPYPAATHPWNTGDDPVWTIRVMPNATGYIEEQNHQQFKTSNLAYNITIQATQKTFNLNGTYWTYRTPLSATSTSSANPEPEPAPGCDPYPRSGGSIGGNLGQTVPGGGQSICDESLNNTFYAVFPRTEAGVAPGIWNYSVRVTDVAGYTRVINGTLDLEDFLPEIVQWNLSAAEVTPPNTIRVQAEITDDNNEVAGAYLNLTRTAPGDGATVNITLTRRTEDASGGTTRFLYDENVSVRRGSPTAIGLGGTFNATIHVVDDVGNWNATGLPGTFVIKDEDAPQLTAFGAIPNVLEIGENVTFWANASDATNVTMKLEIFRAVGSSELLMDPILIPQPAGSGPWNYTTHLNFSAEAVHSFRLTAIDSTGRASVPGTGTITVRDNLGPKYDVLSPSFMVDGNRYGPATPRIEVVVRDVEGVQGSSIEMTVGGLPVDFDLLPAPGNINGYLVSYAVPASKKFNHRDVVDVALNATDNSSEALLSQFNFSFVVDDVAPTARLVSIVPSFRDRASDVLNVSLASRFTLAAEDTDGLPTGIPTGGIRYRILGGGPGAETVYSGPFRINDAAGVYTGPRLYQIQFWAEDDVGNFNRQFNVTTVYVDDTPPALFQFFPQGRSINATFVDDRVGVDRAVVWYRLNDQAYVPLPLVEQQGAWTISLPEGVKGDRISYYLQAWDRLENTETFGNATNPYASFDVSNHKPTLRIVTPADGSRVSRTVELRWDAADEDGDALVFTVYYRAPGRTNFVEMQRIENSEARRYNVDTTRFPDGEYTFRVAVGDGGFVTLAETTVTVINRAEAIGAVRVTGDAVPGGTVLVTAEVTKAEAIVSAHLYLDDVKIAEYPMNDEGRDGDETANDGIFSVRVPIDAAGDYRFEIVTQYREDGVLKTSNLSPGSAAFSAKLTPGYILSQYGAIIALIGLLAAVGIGVAVFVVMRRK